MFLIPTIISLFACLLMIIVKGRETFYSRISLIASAIIFLFAFSIMPEQSYNFLGIKNEISLIDKGFSVVFALALMIGTLFAYQDKNKYEKMLALLYGSSAISMVISKDWTIILAYWEIMAIIAMLLIFNKGFTREGQIYINFHILSGALFMIGVVGQIYKNVSYTVYHVGLTDFTEYCLLLGILINLGMFPFSFWLTEGYSITSKNTSVFLSVFTTKTAIYMLLNTFTSLHLLIIIGAIMVVHSSIKAVLSFDIKKILAYALINQLGIMIIAIGIGGNEIQDVILLQVFAHVIYKSGLFMIAGILYKSTNNFDIRSFGRGMIINFDLIINIIIISAASFGFLFTLPSLGKTLITETIELYNNHLLTYLVMASSVAIGLHTGIRLPYYIVFSHNKRANVNEIKTDIFSMIALTSLSLILIVFGFDTSLITVLLSLNVQELNISQIEHIVIVLALGIFIFYIYKKYFSLKHEKSYVTKSFAVRLYGNIVMRINLLFERLNAYYVGLSKYLYGIVLLSSLLQLKLAKIMKADVAINSLLYFSLLITIICLTILEKLY